MTRTTRRIILLALTAVAGAGSFAITFAQRNAGTSAPASRPSQVDALSDWLGAASSQRAEIRHADPAFPDDLARLKCDMAARRGELAAMLRQPGATDEAIRRRVEAFVSASSALQRRVADHLLIIRRHLTPDQQRRLADLCAEVVRSAELPPWRVGTQPVITTATSRPK